MAKRWLEGDCLGGFALCGDGDSDVVDTRLAKFFRDTVSGDLRGVAVAA